MGDVSGVVLGEEPRRSLDVEVGLRALLDPGERVVELRHEGRLRLAQLGVGEPVADHPRPEPEAGEPLVQIARRPLDQPRIERRFKGEHPLRDGTVGRDHDHHHHPRLQEQHLNAVDARRRGRRGGRKREQVGHPRELGRRLPHRLVDLAAHLTEVEARPHRREDPRAGCEQRVGVEAVGGIGRDPPGGGVRMIEVAVALELGELGPDGRRTPLDVQALRDRLRSDGASRLEVRVDDQAKNALLALGEHVGKSRRRLCRHGRPPATGPATAARARLPRCG